MYFYGNTCCDTGWPRGLREVKGLRQAVKCVQLLYTLSACLTSSGASQQTHRLFVQHIMHINNNHTSSPVVHNCHMPMAATACQRLHHSRQRRLDCSGCCSCCPHATQRQCPCACRSGLKAMPQFVIVGTYWPAMTHQLHVLAQVKMAPAQQVCVYQNGCRPAN